MEDKHAPLSTESNTKARRLPPAALRLLALLCRGLLPRGGVSELLQGETLTLRLTEGMTVTVGCGVSLKGNRDFLFLSLLSIYFLLRGQSNSLPAENQQVSSGRRNITGCTDHAKLADKAELFFPLWACNFWFIGSSAANYYGLRLVYLQSLLHLKGVGRQDPTFHSFSFARKKEHATPH